MRGRKQCVSTFSSQPVEGGGHRVLTELDDSLTEDDAGADQHHATCDGGDHNGQDQRCRYLVLRRWPLRSYRESHPLDDHQLCRDLNPAIAWMAASVKWDFLPAALMHVMLSLARTSSSSHRQRMRCVSSSRLQLSDWQWLQFSCTLISHSPWPSMTKIQTQPIRKGFSHTLFLERFACV